MRLPSDAVRWLLSKLPASGKAPVQAFIERRLDRVAGIEPSVLRETARTLDDLLAIDANLRAASQEVRGVLTRRQVAGPSTALAIASLTRGQRAEARRAAVAAIDALDAGVRAMASASAAVAGRAREADRAAHAATAQADAAAAAVATLHARLERLGRPDGEASHTSASSAPTSVPAPAPTTPLGCKVPACEGTHRARGFCGKHYQLWRRDLLEGYVRFEGGVRFDGVLYDADAAFAGHPAKWQDGRVVIDEEISRSRS